MKTAELQSSAVFTEREVIFLELPIEEDQQIKCPEKMILMIGHQSFDVGSLCYSDRSTRPRRHLTPTLVSKSSFIPNRKLVVDKLIRFTSMRLIGKRPMTVTRMLNDFKLFTDFADRQRLKDIFDCGDNSEWAYAEFAKYTGDRYRRGEIGADRAQSIQVNVLKCFKSLTANNNFGSAVRLIQLGNRLRKRETLPADQYEFSHLLAMSHAIFRGLADLLINHEHFPYKLILPNSLAWPTGNYLWIFPTSVWCLPPRYWGSAREQLACPCWPYDYQNGRMNTSQEIWPFFQGKESVKKKRAKSSLTQAVALMESANASAIHHRRLTFAKLAMKAFTLLFMANTGVNPSVLAEIETEDVIDSSVVNQSYRAIKYRAKGLLLTVRVPASLMPDLRRYMILRKFILNGHVTSLLFFRFNVFNHLQEHIKPLCREPLSDLYRIFGDIDPRISPISPRRIRATLNDWYLRSHQVPIVAKIMGHSEQTENRKYGRGSPITHQQEMTEFLVGVSETARVQKVSNSRKSLATGIVLEQGGSCKSYGNPMGITNVASVQPDCKNNCWYCANRQLVADEIDVRKIASAIFVMEHLVDYPEQEMKLRPFIRKCESDLDLIAKTGNSYSMVQKVKSDVFHKGRLTPYWAMKYNQLLDLGVIV